MIKVVDTLPPRARSLWISARDRVFDIGVAKAGGTEAFQLSLEAETVRATARLGARIALTFYPPYR